MDYKRAQRNLNLLIEDGNPNNLHFSDNYNDNPDQFNSSPMKSLSGTQIPEFSLSSDIEENSNPLDHRNKTDRVIRNEADQGIFQEEGKHENITSTDAQETPIFMNTQIQSRLDDANEKDELKGQLNKFKYSFNESQSLAKPLILKRLSMCDEKDDKHVTKKRKRKNSDVNDNGKQVKNSRASNLMGLLSGRAKKVKDIVKKNNKQAGSKSKGSVKGNKIIYDTYDEEEWNTLKKMILVKFPDNSSEDFKEMFEYVYGNGIINNENVETEMDISTNLWGASQQLIPGTQEPTHTPLGSYQESVSQKINFLSLSQVMEDTSFNTANIERFGSRQLIPDIDDKVGIDIENNKSGIMDDANGPVILKENPVDIMVVGNVTESPTKIRENETPIDDINVGDNIAYDSMEEVDSEEKIDIISIDSKYKFKKQTMHFKEDAVIVPRRLIPTERLRAIPQLQPDDNSPIKDNDIIHLTQQSFKISNELVSPIRTEVSNPKVINESLQKSSHPPGQTVQVPATRMGTLNSPQQKKRYKKENIPSRIVIKIKLSDLEGYKANQSEFTFETFDRVNGDDIVYDSYDEASMDDEVILTLVANSDNGNKIKTKRSISTDDIIMTQEVIQSVDGNSNNNNDGIIISRDDKEKLTPATTASTNTDIFVSQSAKEIRVNVRQLGLKTYRTKSEMVESLELASQKLNSPHKQLITSEGVNLSPGSKVDVFTYLTEIAKTFSPETLEKFYTFQAIPVHEIIQMFTERDQFVDRIEEQTVKEWAERNGISLRQ